jgi:hypothetical protein
LAAVVRLTPRSVYHGNEPAHSCTPDGCATLAAVTLLAELNAFFTDHHHCGDLDAGVDGPIVWIACDCGASMARRADERDALASND